MSVRSGQTVVYEFTTSHPTTGAATTADSLPTGTLVVNGADNAAVVTVTLVDTGRYKFSVTLPTLTVGDGVELSVAATVNAIAGKAIVWRDTKDVLLDTNGKVTDNQQTGDSFILANGASGFVALKGDTAAVKVRTDSLNFTVAGKLDVNVLYVFGTIVKGAGTAVNPWGPGP